MTMSGCERHITATRRSRRYVGWYVQQEDSLFSRSLRPSSTSPNIQTPTKKTMLCSKRTFPSARVKPMRRLKIRTNAHLRSDGWRILKPQGGRQQGRPSSCSAVTDEDREASTTDPLMASQSKAFHATLLIPHPFPNIDLGDATPQFQKGFLMLTSEPGFDLEMTKPTGTTLKPYRWSPNELTDERRILIEAFSKTALHRMLMRLSPLPNLKSAFWNASIFLPCRIWDDGRPEVAWDVMDALLSERHRECARSFIQLLLKSWHRPKRPTKELMELIKEMTSQLPNEYPKIESKDSWDGVRSFVEHCILMAPNRWPIVKLSIHPEETHHRLTGCPIQISFPTIQLFAQQLNEQTDVRLSEDMSIFPLPYSWLLSFLSLQVTVSNLIKWVNAERLSRVFEVDGRLPVDSVVNDLQRVQNSNSKMAALGNVLLRFVTVMNRWQSSDNCTNNNSKAESVASQEEIRNFILGQRLMQIPEVAEILFNWCFLRKERNLFDIFPLDIDWTPVLDHVNINLDLTESLEYLNPEVSIGRNFKAFVARIYEELGLVAFWEICERVDLVQIKTDNVLIGYMKGWKGDTIDEIQSWEISHIDPYLSVQYDDFRNFCQKLGYEFQKKHRFDWAMHHPSVQVAKSPHYGWMLVIGKAIWHILIQKYVTSTHPKMPQTKINGMFGDSDRLGILFDVAVDLGLHKIGVQSMGTVVKVLSKSYKNRDVMRNDAATRNYITNTMMQLVASLALDVGMDLAKTMKIIRPHFAKRIDKRILIGDRENFFAVERYVPTALEHRAALKSPLKPTSYYRTDVRLCSPSGEPCFAVMVLTKCRLTKLSDVEIFQHRGDQCVFVQMESTETVVNIDPVKHKQLMQFQSDYFSSILPSEMEKTPIGEQKKHYVVAPIENTGSDIDWSMIEHVISGTVPSEIADLLKCLKGDKDVDEVGRLEAAKRILALDTHYQLTEIDKTAESDVYRSAVGVILFCNDLNQVSHLEEASGTTGLVINHQCLLESARDYISNAQRITDIDVSTDRCLPFTKSYFTCLASLPYVLEMMEQQLLAEDYRKIYSLPGSITTNDMVMALTSNASATISGVGLLESIGHSILQYLYTVAITTQHATLNVGRQSVMRTEMFGRARGSKEATATVMGHSLPMHFLPYKQGQTWYPPGIKPFTMTSIYAEQNPEDDNEISTDGHLDEKDPEDEVDTQIQNGVSHRVPSGFAQNFSDGIPMKHFRVVAALCFLRKGPSAACDYWYRIGAVKLKSYPSKPTVEFQDGPEKYQRLEDVMGYSFRDRRLLARVFMHSSAFPRTGINNESLEFVGDAVADLIMWRYIRGKYPNIQLAEAAPLKMKWTSNDLFSWISASLPLELPSLLMQNVPKFDEAYRNFDGASMTGFEDPGMKKIASDVFEALLGAVLVDSGYSIDTVTQVMLKLMKEPLDDPDKFGIKIPETAVSV